MPFTPAHNQRMKTKTKLILSLCFFGLSGCSQDTPQVSPPELTERQTQMWLRSCAFCHIDGNAGAPVIGVPEQWAVARAKTEEELIESVLEGINDMPPLGYCMACEREDFASLIKFMIPSPINGQPEANE